MRMAVNALKKAGITPFVVLNDTACDYSDILPEGLLLYSRLVNRDHRLLLREVRQRLRRFAGIQPWGVHSLINLQDRMWPCFLDVQAAFPKASCFDPRIVAATAIKANLRFHLATTPWAVPYLLVSRSDISLPSPSFIGALSRLLQTSGDVIVKPVIGLAGQGVVRVRKATLGRRLFGAIQALFDAQSEIYSANTSVFIEDWKRRQSLASMVLIERYVPGVEYSVEGFANHEGAIEDLVIQMKTKQEQIPVFRDLEYEAEHPSSCADILACVKGLLSKLDYRRLPFHIELKVDRDGKAYPIEFNPRMGGGSIVDLVENIHGTNLLEKAFRYTVSSPHPRRTFLTRVLQPKPRQTGKLKKYVGLAALLRHPSCVFVKKIVPEGAVVQAKDREVYLLETCLVGSTRKDVRAHASKLFKNLRAVFSPATEPRSLRGKKP